MTTSFPEWLEPMAATLTQDRFTGPEWIFERKFDGIRLLAFKNGADVRLFSRNRLPQNDSYPAVAAGDREPAGARRDPRRRSHLGLGTSGEADYHVFDILWLDGRDLTAAAARRAPRAVEPAAASAPLEQRARRSTIRSPGSARAAKAGKASSPSGATRIYEHRRSKHWLKMKCEATQEFVVGGFTDPQGKRVGLGALLVGYFEGDDLVFAGKVGTGFDNDAAARSARAARRARDSDRRRSRRRRDCRGCARTGCGRRSSSRSASSSGRGTASCVTRGCSALRTDKAARREVAQGVRRDHPSREGAVPRSDARSPKASWPPTTRRSRR